MKINERFLVESLHADLDHEVHPEDMHRVQNHSHSHQAVVLERDHNPLIMLCRSVFVDVGQQTHGVGHDSQPDPDQQHSSVDDAADHLDAACCLDVVSG